MKTNFRVLSTLSSVLTGLALLCSTGQSIAQDYEVNRFDIGDEASTWARWWGAAPQTYEFDANVDANTNSASGSLKVTVGFDLAAFAGDNQFAALRNFNSGATVDGTQYTNLVFDIRWDPNSPKTAAGNFGYLEYGFRNSDWSQTMLGGFTVPASAADGWVHMVIPINPTLTKLETISGVLLKLWSGSAGGLTGSTVFWLDNVKLIANTNTVLPPPGMGIVRATPGLQLSASASGQQYQRQSVRTQPMDASSNPNSYSWVGNANPVSYAMTIKTFPDAAHSGFQAHMFLAPEAGMPYGPGDTSIDWNAPTLVFIQIANNNDGSATARFMYKTNQPGGNSMLWNTDPAAGGVGNLASISDASPLGTWSATFRNSTEITLTSPSGASTNFAMPVDAAFMFADPLHAYFGIQPNNAGNVGQSAVFSRIQITGVATPLDDNFSGDTLDVAKWAIVAADPPGVVQIYPGAGFWLKWTAPATGFSVLVSPTLAADSWVDAGLVNVVQVGGEKKVLVPAASGTAPQNFFKLMKP